MQLLVFSGITGFNKSELITLLAQKCLVQNGYAPDLYDEASNRFIQYIKFEDELLALDGSNDIPGFLGKPSLHDKIQTIERTFSRIGQKIRDVNAEHVFLDIHLNYCYRSQFLPPIYPANWRELDRTSEARIKVISLIDDVFVIWDNIRQREDLYPQTTLRLREILAWRSVELLQAEAVAYQCTTEERLVRNYLVAVRHPFNTFYNLLFQENPFGLYLSFPITNTRSDLECIHNINDFRKAMYSMASRLGVVVFDPVAIDELALRSAEVEGDNRIITEKSRWPLETETLVNDPEWPIILPDAEVIEAEPDLLNNIRVRDYKLIDNSIFTVAYRKNYKGASRGVAEEIRYTNIRGKRAYVYDPEEDSEAGEPHPFDPAEIGSRNLNEFYETIERGIRAHDTIRLR